LRKGGLAEKLRAQELQLELEAEEDSLGDKGSKYGTFIQRNKDKMRKLSEGLGENLNFLSPGKQEHKYPDIDSPIPSNPDSPKDRPILEKKGQLPCSLDIFKHANKNLTLEEGQKPILPVKSQSRSRSQPKNAADPFSKKMIPRDHPIQNPYPILNSTNPRIENQDFYQSHLTTQSASKTTFLQTDFSENQKLINNFANTTPMRKSPCETYYAMLDMHCTDKEKNRKFRERLNKSLREPRPTNVKQNIDNIWLGLGQVNSGKKSEVGIQGDSAELEGRRGFIASDQEEKRGFDGGQMKKEIKYFVKRSGDIVGNIAKLRRDNFNFLS
jgi:hypothetical protein